MGHFGREFSMRELCSLLHDDVTCSERLGVARFSHKGLNIVIYKTGRIDVHGVESEEEAIAVINDIETIVDAAFVKTHVDELIAALRDKDPKVRQDAAATLGEVADERAIEPLTHALTDSDADVRLNAAFAMGMIGDARGIAPLTLALKDEGDEVVCGALRTALDMINKNVMSRKMRIF